MLFLTRTPLSVKNFYFLTKALEGILFFNSFLYALYFLEGTLNLALDLIPLNAREPIFVNFVDLVSAD